MLKVSASVTSFLVSILKSALMLRIAIQIHPAPYVMTPKNIDFTRTKQVKVHEEDAKEPKTQEKRPVTWY